MDFLKRNLPIILFGVLLCYGSLLLFSVNYLVIGPGLDTSWGFAMNQFSHSQFKFGVDLVLTYGPLSYLAVPQHVGHNIADALLVHTLIWCVLLYLITGLWIHGKRAGAVIFLLGLIASNRLFFFYWDYLLAAVAFLVFIRLLDEPQDWASLVILVLIAALSFLVKFTAFITIMLLLVVYAVSRLIPLRKAAVSELALLALAVLSGPLAYLLYNPSLSGLIGYTRGSLQMSSGYSAAMSLPATYEQGLLAVLLCSTLVACAVFSAGRKLVTPTGAAMAIALGWMALKHGYVRSDPYHEAVFCCAVTLALAFLLAQIRYTPRLVVPYLAVAGLFSGFALQGANGAWPVWSRFWWSPSMNMTQVAALLSWDMEMKALDSASEDAFRGSFMADYSATLDHSRVLFFPWDISRGAYQQFTTVPLYATQAYSAYTYYLDRESASHLANASRPIDYVVFEWESIDTRNPLADVPATWNVLFSHFAPVSTKPDILLLKRRSSPLSMTFDGSSKSVYRPGAWVLIPERSTPVGLSISLKPTFAGFVLQTLYKTDSVFLQFRTRSGFTSEFRVPPDVLSSPFPINSLPLTPDALTALWKGNEVVDPIAAIRLAGAGLEHLHCDGYQFYEVRGTEIRVRSLSASAH